MDLRATRALAILSMLQAIGWRKELEKNASSPFLLMKCSQIDHTLVSVFYWNLVTQPHLVTREAENVAIWPGEMRGFSIHRNLIASTY